MEDKKKLLILTADAGFGHRSAAKALGQAVDHWFATDWEYLIHNPLDDKDCPSFLSNSQRDYDKIATRMPELYALGYDASDNPATAAALERWLMILLFKPIRKIINTYKPDLIITCYPMYMAPVGAVCAVRDKNIPLVTVITDLANVHQMWFSTHSDLTIATSKPVYELALATGIKKDGVELLGIPVNPVFALKHPPREDLRSSLGWDRQKPVVLVTGSKRSKKYIHTARLLDQTGFDFQIALVCGGDDEGYKELEGLEWKHPVHTYNFVTNLQDMLLASNLVVCKAGGLIVSESLAAGLPLLLTERIPGQESGNADLVLRKGAGLMAETPELMVQAFTRLMENNASELERHARQAQALGKPQAARQIIQASLRLYKQEQILAGLEPPPATGLFSRRQARKTRANLPPIPRLLELVESLGWGE